MFAWPPASAALRPCGYGFSQDVTGSVQGRVTDPTGATIPNVRLELINERTNATATQTTTGEGTYIFNLVPPGRYKIRASASGFGTAELTGITVDVNRATRADVGLTVGTVSETVEVSASVSRVTRSRPRSAPAQIPRW
jgi:hypothetical protein